MKRDPEVLLPPMSYEDFVKTYWSWFESEGLSLDGIRMGTGGRLWTALTGERLPA